MSYIFLKTKDADNDHDNTDVYVLYEDEGAPIADVIIEFKKFLLACGYHPETVEENIPLEV